MSEDPILMCFMSQNKHIKCSKITIQPQTIYLSPKGNRVRVLNIITKFAFISIKKADHNMHIKVQIQSRGSQAASIIFLSKYLSKNLK